MASPEILAVHIMKTAGTSLRAMITEGLGPEAVYPNDADLQKMHKGWYPGPRALEETFHADEAHGARLLIGHVPFILAESFDPRPVTVSLLRDPIARAVSMLEHRRTRTKRFAGATLQDLLDDELVVEGQIRDYQTKIFAFDSVDECPDHVNVPLEIDDARFARALGRLEQVDALGVVEQFPRFASRLQEVTGLRTGQPPQANRGSYDRDRLDPDVRERLEELTRRDRVLYDRAGELIAAHGPRRRAGGRRWSLRRSAPRR